MEEVEEVGRGWTVRCDMGWGTSVWVAGWLLLGSSASLSSQSWYEGGWVLACLGSLGREIMHRR